MRLSLPFALSLALSTPAAALDGNTASDQTSLNQGADQAFKAADAKLNKVYGDVVARLNRRASFDDKGLLTAAQRNWVAFRDAECAFKTSGSEGGSMHPMDLLGCRQQLTEKRTTELKTYLSCKAEDSDCPTAPAK